MAGQRIRRGGNIMNNRLVSKNKALNVSLVKHSGEYYIMKLDIQSEIMKKDIHMVYKKYLNRPKLRRKILDMMGTYRGASSRGSYANSGRISC